LFFDCPQRQEGEVLYRGARRSHRLLTGIVPEIHATSDVVRPVLRDLNRGGANAIDHVGGAAFRDRRAERPRRTRLDRAQDIVGSTACRGNERLRADTKHRGQYVGASGVRADPPVVEDCELPCGIAVEPVGNAVGVRLVVEGDGRVSAVAPRLRPDRPHRHSAATAGAVAGSPRKFDMDAPPVSRYGPFSRTRTAAMPSEYLRGRSV
jgi:hypothetical protein